jgi:hypothetical protein
VKGLFEASGDHVRSEGVGVILQRNANWVSHLIAVLAEQLTATLFEEFQKLRTERDLFA